MPFRGAHAFGCEKRLTAWVPRLQALWAAGFQSREPRRVAGLDAVGAAQQHVSCFPRPCTSPTRAVQCNTQNTQPQLQSVL